MGKCDSYASALNEPETSLHPDLIDALARLIVRVSKSTQLWTTTHSQALAERVEQHSGLSRVRLAMAAGETTIACVYSELAGPHIIAASQR